MAGYSGTPLAQKLGIKAGSRVALVAPPDGFPALLAPLPDGVVFDTASAGGLGVVVCFVTSRLDLEDRFAQLARAIAPNGGLWIAWPKKASGVATDLNENVVRDIGLARGLVDNKVCAVDDIWSGLRFVIRVADRPRERQ